MAKQEVLIQLITNGRPGWQVREPVDAKLCRKMTDKELKAIGTAVVNELGAIIRSGAPETSIERFVHGGQSAQKAADEVIAAHQNKKKK